MAKPNKKKRPLVVVRTYSAGVHVGRLVSRKGREVVLDEARRLWRWRGANTLNEVAANGVAQEYTRLSEPVSGVVLTEAIEVLPVSESAAPSLTKSRWAP